MTFVYQASRVVLKAAVRSYYDLHVAHPERVPADSPAVFVSNHPSSLLDPVVIGAATDRSLHFVAKSTLFKGLFGRFLRSAGAIPVYRKVDNVDMQGNTQTFDACIEVMQRRGAICIFPEGLSHTDPQLKQLKTGAARIALESEEKSGWSLGVTLVPVGLSFQHAPRLRSRVTVNFGKPIPVAGMRAAFEQDPRAAAQELTDQIEARLEKLILHIEKLELSQVVADVRRIFLVEITGEERSPESDLESSQEIANAVALFINRDPERSWALARRIRRYLERLERLGLKDEIVRRRARDVAITRESLRLAVWGTLLLPLALYGLVVNYVPIRAAYWSGRLLAPQASVVATSRFVAALAGVLLTWPLELYLAYRAWGPAGAAIFGASLPLTGYLAVIYPRLFSVYIDRLRSAWLKKTRRRFVTKLRTQRAALIEELDRLRSLYLAGVASGGEGLGAPGRPSVVPAAASEGPPEDPATKAP